MELETLELRTKAERCSGGRVFFHAAPPGRSQMLHLVNNIASLGLKKTVYVDWYLCAWWQTDWALN